MYNKLVLEHFLNPKNVGQIPDADGVGTIGDPRCGDYLRVYIKVEDDHLKDIKFELLGCPAAIATSSVLTEMAMGKSLIEALQITDKDIVKELGELPNPKIHCSNLGAEALHKAIRHYLERLSEKARKS
ncbi:MAG: iron-sulfur cluster assembly scaffold protein [Firmicutes bacterium]|nr:iron-sulfur cluster assembly scaffold protein [Bacillota bacterium]